MVNTDPFLMLFLSNPKRVNTMRMHFKNSPPVSVEYSKVMAEKNIVVMIENEKLLETNVSVF